MSQDEGAPTPTSLLHRWLADRLRAEERVWLEDRQADIRGGAAAQKFFLAFSSVPRHTGKADLDLSGDERAAAEAAREGWQPGGWSADQAGRALLVLALPHEDAPDAYLRTLERAFTHADAGEAVALYQSLPLLPYPERHRARSAEGLRTNMSSVFNAIALHNPYPAEQFDEGAWNQMVLKAIFVGSPLHHIYGLDRRANETLARMLVDYAHERWAAGRDVTPALWRPVGPFAKGETIEDLKTVLARTDPAQREAAALALAHSPADEAGAALADAPELRAATDEGRLTWKRLSQERLEERS